VQHARFVLDPGDVDASGFGRPASRRQLTALEVSDANRAQGICDPSIARQGTDGYPLADVL
jgi:hypothetical protein